MTIFTLLVSVLIFVACGIDHKPRPQPEPETEVEAVESVFAPIPGPAGQDGSNGSNGSDGSDGINGNDGSQGPQGPQGVAGQAGQAGPQGAPGQPGRDGVCTIPTIVVSPAPVPSSTPTTLPVVLTGVYLLPNSGTLELVEDFNRAVLLIGTQRIRVENADRTLGTLPTLSSSTRHVRVNETTVIIDTVVKFTRHHNILALGLRSDANRRVLLQISKRPDRKIDLTVHVYDAAGTSVLVLERQVSQ